MRPIFRLLSFAFAAVVLTVAPVAASAQGHGGGGSHGGGGWHGGGGHWGGGGWHGHGHGWGWGGVSIGVGFGAPWYYPYYPYYYGYPYGYPGYVVSAPAYPVATSPSGDTVVSTAPQQTAPEPVVYPRNGQSAEQTEADRRDCDRWAMSQPRAMADANVFHRATLACLEGRGYTVR